MARPTRRLCLTILVCLSLMVLCTCDRSSPNSTTVLRPRSDLETVKALESTYQEISSKVLPSVVQVLSDYGGNSDSSSSGGDDPLESLRHYFRPNGSPRNQGQGSGFMVEPAGLIVTNAHVVSGARHVHVRLADGRQLPASVSGIDSRSDVALLKIDPEAARPLQWADSNGLTAGSIVPAFGNPFGLRNSVSAGIVSALDRRGPRQTTKVYIQTDAAINQSNSGGPLVDLDGGIMGVNTWIISRDGSNTPGGTEVIDMLRADLNAAGIPYRDEAGRVADFHALRHTLGTLLAASGTHAKVAQSLMRHSDINLMMSLYSHSYREDEAAAVGRLPDLSRRGGQSAVATGTEDASAPDPVLASCLAQQERLGEAQVDSGGQKEVHQGKDVTGCQATEKRLQSHRQPDTGRVPEWTKGADCKSVGLCPSWVRIPPRPFTHRLARCRAVSRNRAYCKVLLPSGPSLASPSCRAARSRIS